jgi:aminoglycoside phosphotransferase (APT) family kinase protein
MASQLHDDQIACDADLVRRLLQAFCPQWADLPLKPVASTGTDHYVFRLGEALCVRVPMRPSAAAQLASEARWLGTIAHALPVAVPEVMYAGEASALLPWPWSVRRWISGQVIAEDARLESPHLAADLAAIIQALQAVDPADMPPPGPHNFGRGCPLSARDAVTRAALGQLPPSLEPQQLKAAWDRALSARVHEGPGAVVHGDINRGNLVLDTAGRINGLLDWGGLAAGDPAVDLMAAWTVLDAPARAALLDRLRPDDALWQRARGWALSVAALQWPYYSTSNPALANRAAVVLLSVLEPD